MAEPVPHRAEKQAVNEQGKYASPEAADRLLTRLSALHLKSPVIGGYSHSPEGGLTPLIPGRRPTAVVQVCPEPQAGGG